MCVVDKIHCIRGYKLWSPRIPREHNKYHGYTVRGTPNSPLIVEVPKNLYNTFFPWKCSKVFGEGGVNTPQDIAQYIWAVLKSIVRLDMLSSFETCLKECDANNLKTLHLPIPQNIKINVLLVWSLSFMPPSLTCRDTTYSWQRKHVPNHRLKNGFFWKMIFTPTKITVKLGNQPINSYKKWWPRTSRVL